MTDNSQTLAPSPPDPDGLFDHLRVLFDDLDILDSQLEMFRALYADLAVWPDRLAADGLGPSTQTLDELADTLAALIAGRHELDPVRQWVKHAERHAAHLTVSKTPDNQGKD